MWDESYFRSDRVVLSRHHIENAAGACKNPAGHLEVIMSLISDDRREPISRHRAMDLSRLSLRHNLIDLRMISIVGNNNPFYERLCHLIAPIRNRIPLGGVVPIF